MHSAPSVRFPVGRCHFHALLLLFAWFAAAAVTAAFVLVPAVAGWRQGVAVSVLLACGVAAMWGWHAAPAGELRWDSERWYWAATAGRAGFAEAEGAVAVALDLQSVLLLAFREKGRPYRWLWLECAADAPLWADLRRAVYSRATIAALREPEDDFRAEAAAPR